RPRHPGRSHDDPLTAPAERPRARSAEGRSVLVGVPTGPGRRGACLRLLLGGDRVPSNGLRLVLHRGLHPSDPRDGLDPHTRRPPPLPIRPPPPLPPAPSGYRTRPAGG